MPWSNSTETAQESSSNSPTVVAFTNPVYLATDEVEIEKQGAITADPVDEDLPLNDVGGANPPAAVIGVGQGTEEAFAGFEDVTEAPESQEGDDAKRTFTPTAVLSPTAAPTAAATPTLPAAEEDTFNGFDLDNLGSPGSFAETDAATVGIGGWATAKSLSMPAHGSSSNTTAASSNAAYLDAAPPVALGDRVTVDGYKSEGTVRFVGPHKSKGSMRVGVELDKQVGKNNGTLGGHVYFAAKERHGVLCFPNDCTIISTAGVDTGAATVVDNSKGKVIVSDMPWMEL